MGPSVSAACARQMRPNPWRVALRVLLAAAAVVLLSALVAGSAAAQTGEPARQDPTPVLVPPELPRVTPIPLTTPPPAATPIPTVDPSTGGQLLQIPAGSEPGAVAVITPAASDVAGGATLAVPAPAPGADPFVVRLQPVSPSDVAAELPAGATASRAIDFSVLDPTSGARVELEGIKVSFPVTDADIEAGNLSVFRIDRTVTPTRVEALTCDLNASARVLICSIEKASIFALGRTQTVQAITYRAFVSNIAKNAAAVLGSSLPANAVSSYSIFNNGERDANITVTFYGSAGQTVLASPVSYVISPGRSVHQYVPNLAELPDGTFSAVFQSDQPFSVTANVGTALGASGGVGGSSVSGLRESQASRNLFIPAVYSSYFGFDSAITVQNTDLSGTASATIRVLDRAGQVALTATLQVPPGAAQAFDLSGLPPNSLNSATIASDRDVTATFTVFTAAGAFASGSALRVGSPVLHAPALYSNYFGYVSSIVVQNVTNESADVTVTYSNGTTHSVTIPALASTVFYQPNEGLPDQFRGSAMIRSTNGQNLVATINVAHAGLGSLESATGVASGDQSVTLTALFKAYATERWVSSFIVQNVSPRTADDVRVVYDSGLVQSLGALAPGASALVYLPNIAELPDGFHGGALVFSTDALPLAVVVNIDATAGDLPLGDRLFSYQGTRTP